jgi:hypothetical protein
MALAEEKALLARFAKRAGAGEILNIHDLIIRMPEITSRRIPTHQATADR